MSPELFQKYHPFLDNRTSCSLGHQHELGCWLWDFLEGYLLDTQLITKKLGEYVMTYHEAAILAYLNGRGGAPKLHCANIRTGVLVMEFINDPTLEDFFIFGTLSYDRWLKVLVAVAERLQEVHEAGIVHNDFKLDNCLVSFNYGECNAHIIDFGLSGKIG
ncbi:casein kinase I-like [Penaeus monodon]|uniref:casein kinase I-like n=1 Tax=Penaeus monodon TaxID=6687 RepID=UPI0018A756D3|nr:casein kinase I-like [Penaeus monodon]